MNKIIKPALAATLALSIGLGSTGAFAGDSRFFSDVNDNSYGWASDYVDQIAAKGIASGIGDNKFAPESLIKRGDFAVFLNKTMGYRDASGDLFIIIDVPEDSYYYQSVINCKYNGAITDTNNFYPESYITRIAAINMIYNALTNAGMVGSYATTDVAKFADRADLLNVKDTISAGTLANIGIISGNSDGNLYPNDTLTRAEMAVVIAKTSEYVDAKNLEFAEKKKAEEQQKLEDSKPTVDETDENVTQLKSGNIDTSVVVDTGKSVIVDDVTIKIDNQDADALTITKGTDITLKDSSIRSVKNTAVSVKEKSKLTADNVTVVAEEASAVSLDSDSELSADQLYITSNGLSSIVTKGGNVSLSNSTIKSTGATAIEATAGAIINITGSAIENTVKGINLFSIVSDPADSDVAAELNIKDSTITNEKGYFVYLRESLANIVIENTDIKVARFINSAFDKKAIQENGNNINVTIKDSKVEGDIYMDHKSELTLNIQDGGSFKGFIDPELYSENINIRLSKGGRLELMGDIYVKDFVMENFDVTFDNIIDNGFNIYYDDTQEANYELFSDTWDLPYGGKLLPK